MSPGMRLLDAGCGLGVETRRLAEENPDVEVVRLDRNDTLGQQAVTGQDGGMSAFTGVLTTAHV